MSKAFFRGFIPILSGVIFIYGIDWYYLGHWDALYLVQAKYHHDLYPFMEMITAHWHQFLANYKNPKGLIELQTFLVSALAIWQIGETVFKKSIREFRPEHFFQVAFILCFWFLPFSMGPEISLYRSCAFLGFCQLFWASKNTSFLALLLILYALFAVQMIAFFYDGTLV